MFRRLVRELTAQLHSIAEHCGRRAQLYLVSNDDDRSFQRIVDEEMAASGGDSPLVEFVAVSGQGNVGYGAGHNLAIRRSTSEFHLVVNPDVELEENGLAEAVAFLSRHREYVLAAPHGTDGEGRYLHLAKRSPTLLVLALRAIGVEPGTGRMGRRVSSYVYSDRLPALQPQDIRLASGCCMLCRTAALKSVGGFDEGFFLFFEDFDLSVRMAAQGKLAEIPGFRIKHYGGNASRRGVLTLVRFARSACRYFHKHGWRLA